MRRQSFDPTAETPSVQEAGPPPRACALCGRMTTYDILSMLGARCSTCYGRYLREPQSANLPSVKHQDDPRAWAKKLRERAQAGERLSPVQQRAWREALGPADLAGEGISDVAA